MERLFLDANVLVSAALTPESRLNRLWQRPDVRLIGSPYVLAEARRNVSGAAAARLEQLLTTLLVLPAEPAEFPVADDPHLPAKDRPVLLAAIASRSDWLLTGDATHFGALYGKSFDGPHVARPGEYLRAEWSEGR